jgi:hypothetical protein
LQQRQLGKEVEARRNVMLAGPDRIEAEGANETHLLQGFGIAASRIVAGGMLRVEVDAESHRLSPVCL